MPREMASTSTRTMSHRRTELSALRCIPNTADVIMTCKFRKVEIGYFWGLVKNSQVLKAFVPPSAQIYLDGASAAAAAVAGIVPEKGAAK